MNWNRSLLACLWALVLASMAAGVDVVCRQIEGRSAAQSLLLLPAQPPDDAARAKILADLKAREGVDSVRWLSPKDLAQKTSRAVSPDLWPSVFAEDEAWLPWIAEVRFKNPIWDRSTVQRTLDQLQADNTWKLRLWDDARINADAATVISIMKVAIPGWVIVFVLGIASLFFIPRSRGTFIKEAVFNAVAAPALAASITLLAQQVGAPIDERAWIMVLATSFTLAGLLAPVLNKSAPNPKQAVAPAKVDE